MINHFWIGNRCVVTAVGLAILVVGCGAADDAARVGARVLATGDEAFRFGSSFGDELARSRPLLDTSPALRSGLASAAEEFATPETRSALLGLAWEVGCDIATGEAPRDRSQLIDWIAQKAAQFGISFFGDAAGDFADLVIAATAADPNAATDSCNRLPESGL